MCLKKRHHVHCCIASFKFVVCAKQFTSSCKGSYVENSRKKGLQVFTYFSSDGAEELGRLNSGGDWRLWGPYLSERQWGTVREDYSTDGNWYES